MTEGVVLTVAGEDFHLGYSRIASYLACPKQFHYSYIENRRGAANAAMRRGTAYHSTLERMLLRKLEKKKPATLEQSLECANRMSKEENLSDSQADQVQLAVSFYHANLYPLHDPIFVEEEFRIFRGGYWLTGRMDLGIRSGRVIDHKFSFDTWAAPRATTGPQPIIYKWAWDDAIAPKYKIPFTGFEYNIIKTFPTTVCQRIEIPTISQAHSNWWEEQISKIGRAIEEGIFPANPSEKVCGFCSHKKICKPCIYEIGLTIIGEHDKFSEDH